MIDKGQWAQQTADALRAKQEAAKDTAPEADRRREAERRRLMEGADARP
jgi:hypothetical protein